MTYTPKKDGRARNIAFALIIAGILVFGISNFLSYAILFQVAATALLVAGLFILVRYVLTDHLYIIDDRDDGRSDLIIMKIQGKKQVKVCHMSLALATGLYEGSPMERADERYCYTQNINPTTHVISFSDGGKSVIIVFEPDEVFVRGIRDRIASATDEGGTFFTM